MAGGIEYASKDAKPCHRFGNRRLDAIFVCDIAGDPDGARQISRGGPCLAAVKIDDGNAASFRREAARRGKAKTRSEEHTSELQSLMRISYAVFCLKKKKQNIQNNIQNKIQQQDHKTNIDKIHSRET